METDLSYALYQKIRSLWDKALEVTMKDGRIMKGKFIGYFLGDIEEGEQYIIQWRVTDADDMSGADAFGFLKGSLIVQSDIAQVKFLQDNSIMKF